jgi:hypothetical protein
MSDIPSRRVRRSRALAVQPPVDGPWIVEPPERSLLNFVAMAVRDPSIEVTKLEALLRMQREIVADDAKLQFNRAYAALAAEITQIERRGVADMRDKGSYKFTKREHLDTMLRPLMAKHGFALSFRPVQGESGITIEGELLHVGGHSKTAALTLPPDVGPGRNSLQAVGSAIAYAERYLTEMLANVVRRDEDTDGRMRNVDTGELITRSQVVELRALMAETRILESVVLAKKAPELDSIEALPAAAFISVRNDLLSRRNVLAQREAQRVTGKMLDAYDAHKNGEARA